LTVKTRDPATILVALLGLLLSDPSVHASGAEGTTSGHLLLVPDAEVWTYQRVPLRRGGGGQDGDSGLRNGDFSEGLTGWQATESGGDTAPGGVLADSAEAVFLEGDSFLVTLEQTFAIPENAGELSLDLRLDPGFDLSDDFIPDAFEITLLGPDGTPLLDPWDALATSSFNLQEDGTSHAGPQASWNGQTVRLDVSSVAPETVATLYLDLIGGDGDTQSSLRVDDAALKSSAAPGSFRRGDVDASGAIDAADVAVIFDAVWESSPDPAGCDGASAPDASDLNDNEVLTIADYLAAWSLEGTAPPCDLDLDDDLRGFDTVDPDYVVSAGDVEVDPPTGGQDRTVLLPILVASPRPLVGLTLVLAYDSSVLTPLDADAGDPVDAFESELGEVRVERGEGVLVIGLWSSDTGATLGSWTPDALQRVGAVAFRLEDFATVRPFEFLSEGSAGGASIRATLVDEAFGDHQPDARSGEYAFVRGNSNNDGRVDISDSIYTLSYLFLGGPEPPCLDAADSNNDSTVDISDAVFSLNFLFLGGAPIPPPYPACGLDSGPVDLLGCAPCSCGPYPPGDPCLEVD
jgi:hypothetical protein